MSKRNLVIIIVLLIVVDIAAALWYLSLRIEASGESHELWQSGEKVTAMADTLATTSLPDAFDVHERHAYYVSDAPAVRGNLDSYYVCVKRVKVRWPRSVNGNDSLPALERALLNRVFGNGNTAGNLNAAAQIWLSRPQFTVETRLDYRLIDGMPKLVGQYAHSEQLLAYPLLTSLRLLVFEVDHLTRHGDRESQTCRFLHYDRVKQTVLERASIIEPSQEPLLLTLINDKIDRLNHDKRLQLERAYKVANEFHATRAGLVFLYPAGEIATVAEGNIDILVDYSLLGPALTQEFKNLLNLNGGYWKYKPLDAGS